MSAARTLPPLSALGDRGRCADAPRRRPSDITSQPYSSSDVPHTPSPAKQHPDVTRRPRGRRHPHHPRGRRSRPRRQRPGRPPAGRLARQPYADEQRRQPWPRRHHGPADTTDHAGVPAASGDHVPSGHGGDIRTPGRDLPVQGGGLYLPGHGAVPPIVGSGLDDLGRAGDDAGAGGHAGPKASTPPHDAESGRPSCMHAHRDTRDHAEAYGEAIAEHHVIPEHYPNATREPLGGPLNGNDQFDQVWRREDGGYAGDKRVFPRHHS
ncbi:hypothetical protein DV517_30390 [Streptomyces sp. S816]|nr:hypothetical protein DV517_30390 [Streptomyces sp. S816]